MLSHPPPALYWAPDVARYNMEALVFLSSGWLRTACILSALVWLVFRAYQVLSLPVEKLVVLLGLEVPVAPLVSLAGIKADGVLLHWKPPDQRASVVKYVIRINGIDIGDVSPQETSVTIENLQPDHHYVIRIVTLNAANFQAPSVPIRLRTLLAETEDFYNAAPQKDTQEGREDADSTPTPIIRPNKNLVDVAVPPTVAPVMAREHSNSTSRVRRSDPGRRNSPASQTVDQARSAQETAASMESIKKLTEKLDSLRRDLDDAERQIRDDEEEFHTMKTLLMEKRDEKRVALKEKEDASRDLRKEVAALERANASAQARRTHQEKILHQKQAERKKLKDDVARWTREAGELQTTAERIEEERAEYESTSEARMQTLKDKYAEVVQINKSLEDAIREKGTQIKALEEERKTLEEGEEGGEAPEGNDTADTEEDRRWVLTLTALQQRYAQAWTLFTEAERANQEASNRLAFLQQRRMSQPQVFNGMPIQDLPARRNSQRARPLSLRDSLASAPPGGFHHPTAVPFNSTVTGASPTFPSGRFYFNYKNGMTLPPPSAIKSSFSQADIDSLTGGAPMSPTAAGALLPSGLFGDDTGLTDAEDEDDPGPPQPLLNPSPHFRNVLAGLGAPGTLDQGRDPSSPVSVQSRSPSVFASPRESAGQLSHYPNLENLDSDRRSIRSTSSSFMNHPPVTRFGGLFGLNRQRGKTLDQGPPLGSLKQSQSQSLPRQESSLDPIGSQRRRGSHSGGAWYDAFVRTKTQPVESTTSPNHVATRKRAFNMFGSKGDPWLTSALGIDRPSSPRQGSTTSAETNPFPRPSTESHTRFGWSIDSFGARSSPLGVDWSMDNNTASPWSRMPSRRPSIQHGSTVSLINEDLLQGDSPDFPSTIRSPTQAPIGTRPQSSASHLPSSSSISPTPPKLNPAAPQFKSIFLREKKSEEDKAEKARRAAEKAAEKEAKKAERKEEKKAKAEKSHKGKDKEKAAETSASGSLHSPQDPRHSRDTPSLSTADLSDASPRESLERSLSQTTAESLTPANTLGKETLMQKLSRKGSSIQFSKKNSLFSKKSSETVAPDEMDGEFGGSLARSVDSVGNSPSIGTPKDKTSALSWSSIKQIGKRKDKTPSLHESIASETTGDEDEWYVESVRS
ncbi:hypothetical protein BDV95DRAFT_612904 [Massariosphaeria phaeospora]|uniref:Fibronectin type-III domain-containing protein n=1 Tax=Massariosphaeria phaeospora TaxID=100035 RepID=A0A7C8M0J3_9PLEO|nr:hypothetical protein BDV95DRAFT_612904 [Massariosphaeria phaeospora]